MNTVVSQLLDIDKEARMILDEAQQYYNKTIEELALEKKELVDKYNQKARAHLESVQKTAQAAASEASAENDKLYARLKQELEERFSENRAAWEDELVKRCLGR